MKALCWNGVNRVDVERMPDPEIVNEQDAIVKVKLSSVCGSDLHQISDYIPTMRAGDVIGHEFLGEVVEVGPRVHKHSVGDRVVVCSVIACRRCFFCEKGLFSLCENGNTNPAITEYMWGQHPAGIFGYSHAWGASRAATPSISGCPTPTPWRSRCLSRSTTRRRFLPQTRRLPGGWALRWATSQGPHHPRTRAHG